uniref:GE-rich salivary protein 30k-4 n=1 Tax=Aedes albopictus TaxID=7160 RepID=Q5MIT8_AEDAL|nr:GE-rich salivary protein 30k-4 [Aedes albopictus]
MKPLAKLFMMFCLIGIVLSRPMPEDEEGEGEEESPDDASGDETEGGEEKTDDGASEDGGEEESKADEEDGGENADGEDAGGDDAGGENADGENTDGENTDGENADGEDAEGSKDEGDDSEGDGGKEESTGGDEGGDNAGGGEGGGENDPVNTYHKVVAILDKDTKVDNIQSEYLRSALNNDLQSEVRNPVVEAISRLGSFSKIEGCFKSMGSDVKKVIDEEQKAFKDCMTKKKSEYECSEDSFASAKGKLSPITSKIKSCVSSKGQ